MLQAAVKNDQDPAFLEEVARLRASGALGRSAQLQRLFDFLVRCHAEGRTPKEIEVAIGAFGREAGFDAGQDALVRVHAHKLRKRLEEHYQLESPAAQYRLYVPRGEYRLAAAIEGAAAPGAPPNLRVLRPEGPPVRHAPPVRWAWALCAVLALATVVLLWREWQRSGAAQEGAAARASVLWAPLFADDLPIQLVLGDYYIFGERDEGKGIRRLIRDFDVNSREDLEQRFIADPTQAARFADLNLGYLPTSSAQALRQVLPVLTSSGKRVSLTLASELDPSTIKSTHIVYIGYLSALGMLRDMAFAGSRYSFGGSFDELIDHETGQAWVSEAGESHRDDERFRDYAYLSTFSGPGGNQHLVIAGARDTGLMQSAENAADAAQLQVLKTRTSDAREWEALYEVHGVNGTNIESRLVGASSLQPPPEQME
jgi:hypothetical protein